MSDKTPPRDQLEPDEAPQPSPRISISARAYADLRSDIKFLRSDNADLRQHNHQLNSIVSDRGAPARVDPEPATAEALHPFLAAASGVQRPRPSMTGASIQTSSSELPRSSSAYSAAELLRGLGVVNKTQNNGPLSRTGSSVSNFGGASGSGSSRDKATVHFSNDCIVISSDEDDGRGHDDESSVRGGEKTKSSSASAGKGNNLKKKSNIVVARMAHKGKRGRANKGASKKKKAGGDGHEQEKVGEAEDMEDGEEEEISPKSMCPLCDRLIEVEYFSEVEDEPVMADEVSKNRGSAAMSQHVGNGITSAA
ncbi:hypothetical protein CF335_g7930 [Tilletia laevis]|nr:hypothetical protein CF335_g7930 [Tilletia laevis]